MGTAPSLLNGANTSTSTTNNNSASTSTTATSTNKCSAPAQRYADPSGRIVIDIRGANLHHRGYNVAIKETSAGRDAEARVRAVTGPMQAIGGVFLTALTLQKLWEEIRFMRHLRRELGSVSSPSMPGSGMDSDAQGATAAAAATSAARNNRVSVADGAAGPGRGREVLSLSAVTASLPTQSARHEAAISFEQIAGLTECKVLLQEVTVLPFLRPDLFKGIRQPPRGILLFGPPGSGKTMLARAVSGESHATFFPVTGSSVLSMWYGQSEQNIRALFAKAKRQQPSVIFIDEVDSLMGKRSGRDVGTNGADSRVTNEFLAFIDGIQTGCEDMSRIVVIAATNHPWELDEAALSRFARRIYVPLPDRATRVDLLRKAMAGVPCCVTEDEWSRLGEQAGRYSGRDLVHICREASMRPMRELWGSRLVSSGGTASGTATGAREKVAESAAVNARILVKHRLVAAVAAGLERGTPRRRLRREVDAWRKANKVDWCNVDEVLCLADAECQLRKNGSSSGPIGSSTSGTATATAPVTVTAPAGDAGRTQGDAPGNSSSGAAVGSDMSNTATAVAAAPATAVGDAATGSLLEPVAQNAVEGGSSTASTSTLQAPAVEAARSQSRCTAGTSSTAADGSTNRRTDAGEDVSSKESSVAASTPVDEGNSNGAAAAPDAEPAAAATAAASTSATAPAAAATTSATTATPVAPAKSKRAAAASAASAAAVATSAEAAGRPAFSIQDLLTLPADKVRPVSYADFTAAFSIIMAGEFDLTSRFEEWNSQFGSGVDKKQTGGLKRW